MSSSAHGDDRPVPSPLAPAAAPPPTAVHSPPPAPRNGEQESEWATLFAEVSFKGARKGYFGSRGIDLSTGDRVIVEAEGGWDLGRVTALGAVAERKCSTSTGCATPTPELDVIRLATKNDVAKLPELRADDERVCRRAREMALESGLEMKFSDAEWRFDRRYLILYFTAPRRVDFRRFLPELARTFRARVRLEHLTAREEAKQLGGVGRCGREQCCSTWMTSFRKVTVAVARDQDLSLNPEQISGNCGRLMCCLLHEHSSYVEARRRFPRKGRVLALADGRERVVDIDIFKEEVWLKNDDGDRRMVTLGDLQKEMAAPRAERRA